MNPIARPLRFLICGLAFLLVGGLVGCMNHAPIPKDSAFFGGINVGGPYGHGETKGALLTGKAATPENIKAVADALPGLLK